MWVLVLSWNYFTQIFGGQTALNSLIISLPKRRFMSFTVKASNVWTTFGIVSIGSFLSWEEARTKFKLSEIDNEDWIWLTSKIIDKLWHVLEKYPKPIYPCQWIGFFHQGVKDLVCHDVQAASSHLVGIFITYPYPLLVNALRSLFIQDVLVNGNNPLGSSQVFQYFKIIYANRGPKRVVNKRKFIFLWWGEWNPNRWSWVAGYHFLNHISKFSRD